MRLLDVNVLLAVAWPIHQHHSAALRWLEREARAGWATCALTELGFVRLSSNPAFTRQAVTPPEAIELLGRLRGFGKHRFLDALPSVDVLASLPLAGHQQLTDAFLVKTAELHRGMLVTFDRGAVVHDPSRKRVLVLDPEA